MKTLTNRTMRRMAVSLAAILLVISVSAGNKESIEIENLDDEVTIEITISVEANNFEMESWMTNPATWTAELSVNLESDVEESMNIEIWMTRIENSSWDIETTLEEEEDVEAWMLNPTAWLNK